MKGEYKVLGGLALGNPTELLSPSPGSHLRNHWESLLKYKGPALQGIGNPRGQADLFSQEGEGLQTSLNCPLPPLALVYQNTKSLSVWCQKYLEAKQCGGKGMGVSVRQVCEETWAPLFAGYVNWGRHSPL